MWFSKSTNGYTGWFAVVSGAGTLRTGLLTSNFTVTVRNPGDTVSLLPSASQSGKPGLYKFPVTSSFFQTHGPGQYGVVVQISATGPSLTDAFAEVLTVSQNDFDSLLPSSSIATIVSGTTDSVWDVNMSTHNLSGSAGALLRSASTGPTPVIDTGAIADAVWDEQLFGHLTSGSAGFIVSQLSGSMGTVMGDVSFIKYIEGGRWRIVSNQMIFYRDDNVTEVARFNLFDSGGSPSSDNVFERTRV